MHGLSCKVFVVGLTHRARTGPSFPLTYVRREAPVGVGAWRGVG